MDGLHGDAADWDLALALLEWQVDLGVTEAILDAPVDRYALAEAAVRPAVGAAEQPAVPVARAADPVDEARRAAEAAGSLEALREAVAAYEHCDLKRGARNTVFCDGNPLARLMLIGEAPGREEDAAGRPFVGRAGQLLDRMLAAIGISRTSPDPEAAIYITNVMPWRPPQNRDPSAAEVAMMKPFLARHVELVAPEVIVLMGNTACAAVLGRTGITRLRGRWAEAYGRPVLPMCHPAYLLRQPEAKRESWADLLDLKARLGR
ncbi:uracil-DNA glycosylase [Cereibacter sphaeroides]|uniref:uracil-DNA glycosylase n=1 Tax=Cereibacter sphaeroides TaxID=1063 RepID=UPI001F4667B3|nr:uracil-DNA glycosylase [Cereibacter sphaeroides]MCE6951200.1 uracil-DNA glycosylase [Cereibacter sphaeroides]